LGHKSSENFYLPKENNLKSKKNQIVPMLGNVISVTHPRGFKKKIQNLKRKLRSKNKFYSHINYYLWIKLGYTCVIIIVV